MFRAYILIAPLSILLMISRSSFFQKFSISVQNQDFIFFFKQEVLKKSIFGCLEKRRQAEEVLAAGIEGIQDQIVLHRAFYIFVFF